MIPLAALLLCAQDAAPPPTLLAVTRAGVRVEAAAAPARGDLEVVTPYGIYSTPLDPVAVTLRTAPRRDWQRPELAAPGPAALATIEELEADGRLGELIELVAWADEHWTTPDDGPRRVAAHEALERWGARLAQVPSDVPYEKRTEWLWRELRAEPGPRAHLLLGALLESLPRYSDTSNRGRLPYSELSAAFDERAPRLRRAAALALGRQGDGDRLHVARLLELSLREPDASARDAAGRAAAELWPEAADAFWWSALARGEDAERAAAAEHFVARGGERTVDYLAFVLSAHDRRAGQRYELAGKSVQVVLGTSSPALPTFSSAPDGLLGTGAPFATTPDVDRFEHVSVIKVTRLDDALVARLVQALARRTGEGAERGPAEWLAWYRALPPGS